MRGERDWLTLIDLLDELPMGSRYAACLMEDEELVDPDKPYDKPEPAESPSWREFDRAAYDFAQIIALLQQILVAACRGDPSRAGVEPWLPVAAAARVKRRKRLTKLRATVVRALGTRKEV